MDMYEKMLCENGVDSMEILKGILILMQRLNRNSYKKLVSLKVML
jgi:hypothetical protein